MASQPSTIAARRRRIGLLRRRAVLLSAAVFGLSWAVVFLQLVSGHDPALGNDRKQAAPPIRQAPPRPPVAYSSTDPYGGEDRSADPDPYGNGDTASSPYPSATPYAYQPPARPAPAPPPPPVTTRQS